MKNSLRKKIKSGPIPNHIAIIMDGNGRWAKERNLPRISGHKEGINSVREVTRICGELGVKYLTLYTFSTENWNRPQKEVSALMKLLLKTINFEIKELHKNNVRFSTIGELSELPESTQLGIKNGVDLTRNNSGLNLILALNYGSRQEIIKAVQMLSQSASQGNLEPLSIDENVFKSALETKDKPDPDLLIRTSGELRLSNFLLWQSAYAEIYLTETYWPAFREDALMYAILDYQGRERRFGQVSAQVQS
jgi:undecaprenyl diphosphate synthase